MKVASQTDPGRLLPRWQEHRGVTILGLFRDAKRGGPDFMEGCGHVA